MQLKKQLRVSIFIEIRKIDRVFSSGFLLIHSILIAGSVRPFRLYFHTDATEAPNDIDNKGFCLDYVQQPCTNG